MFAYILLSICENHGTQVKDVYLDADKANDDYAALIASNNTSYMRYQLITRTILVPAPKVGIVEAVENWRKGQEPDLRCGHSSVDFKGGICQRCGNTNPDSPFMAPIPLTRVLGSEGEKELTDRVREKLMGDPGAAPVPE